MGSKKRSKSSLRDREDSKKYKKRRRKDATSPPAPNGRELLIAASLGDHHRCRELLRQRADVDWSDGDLTTSLHASSRIGHLKTVQVLLRYGANASLQDLKGDTAAHLAARNLHLDTVSVLLRSKTIGGSLQEPNDKGETVEELAAKAMKQQEIQAKLAQEEKQQSKRRNGDNFEKEVQVDWEEKLRRELSPGEEEAYYYYDHSTWNADQFETAEEYAKRIWMEMEGRDKEKSKREFLRKEKESKPDPFDAAKKASSRDQKWAQQEGARGRQEKEGKEEEAEWRAAKAGGSASLKRASYEARWDFFCSKNNGKIAKFADIPWILPPKKTTFTNAASVLSELEHVLLHSTGTANSSPDIKRQILRRELIRWHPDKFIGKFGALLDPGDRDKILSAVTDTSQQLTQLLTATARMAAR
ncbi:hypothetical protein Ndes2526A_g05071 [Nannochloris sp. 'desiccata']